MNFFNATYTYDLTPLLTYQGSDMVNIGLITSVGLALYFLLPELKKMFEIAKMRKEKKDKKKIISDLILMKELQGEIEQEMREALIHSELHSKKENQPLE